MNPILTETSISERFPKFYVLCKLAIRPGYKFRDEIVEEDIDERAARIGVYERGTNLCVTYMVIEHMAEGGFMFDYVFEKE